MSDTEISEIKELRNALHDLCTSISKIISTGHLNTSPEQKKELNGYIDDVLLWFYSCDKPSKSDYRDKIDYVNSICNEMVSYYQKEGIEMFKRSNLEGTNENSSQQLEKLILMILTMIDENQIIGANARLELLKIKLKTILKYVYTQNSSGDNSLTSESLMAPDQNNNHIDSFEQFQKRCAEYIIEVNQMCDNIHNSVQGISLNMGPTVTLSTKVEVIKEKEEDDDDESNGGGMTIMELLRIKQNEELTESINKMVMENNDK